MFNPMKEIPSTMFIELALDMLRAERLAAIESEIRQFRAVGTSYIDKLTAPLLASSPYLSSPPMGPPRSDLEIGYLLGVETARAMLATMPAAVDAGIQI